MSEKLTAGLSSEEVRKRIEAGQVNGEQQVRTKTYGKIIRDNLFTLFNLINVILLVCILLTGSYKNALFFLVVIWNFLIGTFQEVRAKKTIDHLSLLSAPKACVIRDGKTEQIQVKDIVLGDVMLLKSGYQVCADAVVLGGNCQVNESLITGESTPIRKREGDHLLSGSFLISGEVTAEVEHVGSDNYVNQITESAGYYKKPDSVIMKSVNRIVQILAIAMIPLAGLQVWNNFFRMSEGFSADMVRTVATISSMIPGGLVLLVSIVLAVSVVRLSVHKTLVQDLYCVENLARVDMLLLDKTGTITEGVLKVEKTEPLAPFSQEQVLQMLRHYIDVTRDENSTATAIREYIHTVPGNDDTAEKPLANSLLERPSVERPLTDSAVAKRLSAEGRDLLTIPFSSDRKWGLVQMGDQMLILGAPEFILKNQQKKQGQQNQKVQQGQIGERESSIQEQLTKYSEEGKRVVLLAVSRDISIKDQSDDGDYQLPDEAQPAALVIIADQIRKEAPDTFAYFKEEQVSIKVITGDSPVTASRVAAEAGLECAEKWLDASTLEEKAQLEEAADAYTVFGRVTPQQKCQIVKSLQAQGHTVAMIGDGANDVLALKEADCSIAMQNGSDAARNVANMVLLDSNFASLPLVVAEGRKSINNLQRSAALYLTKTTYSFIFSIFFLFAVSLYYPFENIHVTFFGAVSIGIPSFFLALEPNSARIRNHFLANVFRVAVPSGIMEAAALITLLNVLHHAGASDELISTAALYLMLIMGILVVFDICGQLNTWKLLLILGLIGISAGAVLILPDLLTLVVLAPEIWKTILIIAGVFFVVHFAVFRIILPGIEKKHG